MKTVNAIMWCMIPAFLGIFATLIIQHLDDRASVKSVLYTNERMSARLWDTENKLAAMDVELQSALDGEAEALHQVDLLSAELADPFLVYYKIYEGMKKLADANASTGIPVE